jgi:hypothetical protein
VNGNRPIGWWVKRLDELLEQAVEHAVRGAGLTRRHWQVLHDVAGGPTERSALVARLAPFADADGIDGVLGDLTARGWLDEAAAGLTLTADGRAAHERLLVEVSRIRRQVTDGVTPEDYARTVATLERMVTTVESLLGPADRS